MGWGNFAIIYENNSLGYWGNYYLSEAAATQKLYIVNKLRIIPQLLTRNQIKNYSNVFQEIIDTNVRLVALLLSSPLLYYAIELFYDLGMRKGDVILSLQMLLGFLKLPIKMTIHIKE
ncbi:unnamed protein product [Blepharisma stoltei]|uniref:ABC transmembrane type-1 domain-containing protein n=1 Tax=Blepharisma stoltei TaxID=1481888 RepID=A0AAU9K396_9CILI|nr:unnamed protein product [Blepharisma stoltei]